MENSDIANIASKLTYFCSGSITIASTFSWLNNNAAACGVLIALFTAATNFYFRKKMLSLAKEVD